ncbi:hypothetical protein NDU88_003580 [Pleurodeles waltl]|uniref:Uncharacterized protein n=1 Tax=Pleurodeles waltl TaxID=8319 RepID=A0AAV7MS87_PLEWA|nr:hypothetical protein NDU88_003580 [Pleurodeles waltl]
MDSKISTLAAETKSICLDIAGFQSRVAGLEERVAAVEDLNTIPEWDQELLFLRSKLIDSEARSRRDNVSFFGFTEHIEETDIQAFLKKTLSTLTGLSFDPPLEFQRAHCLGLKRTEDSSRPCPTIACQLLTAARSQGPFRANSYVIRIAADFSRDKRRKAFLSLCPCIHQLEVRYNLFELARMWVTKNGQSKDFYDTEDLRLYLDDLSTTSMDLSPLNLPADTTKDPFAALLLLIPTERGNLVIRDSS